MFRRVLDWFTARSGGTDETDAEEKAETKFVPSPLDASVRFAHGMRSGGAERELADVEEKARLLEERRRDE